MEIFYSIASIIALVFILIQVYTYLIRLHRTENNHLEMIKLKSVKATDYFFIANGLLIIILCIIDVIINMNTIRFSFWFLLGVGNINNGILQKGEYILINNEGMKWGYSRIIKWNSIQKITISDNNETMIIFQREPKQIAIDFYSEEKVIEFRNAIDTFLPFKLEF